MDPFETFGLPRRFDLDLSELDRRYRELQKALHPDRHAQAGAAEKRLSLARAVDVNQAYGVLCDERSRAEAILTWLGAGDSDGASSREPDAGLVAFTMELGEELEAARASADGDRVGAVAAKAEALRESALAELCTQLGARVQVAATAACGVEAARAALDKLRFAARLLGEIAEIQDR